MAMKSPPSLFVATLSMVFIGCTESNTSSVENPAKNARIDDAPEGAYRRFMIAYLSGDETTIRPLILDHADASVLWHGAYPTDVASLLAEQYRTMEILRVDSPETRDPDRVVLRSSAVPISLEVVRVNGDWKVDAAPIIAIRKGDPESKP